jgi:hypothetical protein
MPQVRGSLFWVAGAPARSTSTRSSSVPLVRNCSPVWALSPVESARCPVRFSRWSRRSGVVAVDRPLWRRGSSPTTTHSEDVDPGNRKGNKPKPTGPHRTNQTHRSHAQNAAPRSQRHSTEQWSPVRDEKAAGSNPVTRPVSRQVIPFQGGAFALPRTATKCGAHCNEHHARPSTNPSRSTRGTRSRAGPTSLASKADRGPATRRTVPYPSTSVATPSYSPPVQLTHAHLTFRRPLSPLCRT